MTNLVPDRSEKPVQFMTRRTVFSAAAGLPFAALGFTGAPARAAELSITGGPCELLISYRCNAADRPAFRTYWLNDGRAMLEGLRKQGKIVGAEVLFSSFVTPGTWDALATVRFARFEDIDHWRALEHDAPAGLSGAALTIARPFETVNADLSWIGETATRTLPGDPVTYIIPYEYNATAEYRDYVRGYVIPQLEGWLREGILARYRIYMNRYPVGAPWDALFVYTYRDLAAFGRREETIARVRATLKDDPTWRRYHEIKHSLRAESENTIAETLLLV